VVVEKFVNFFLLFFVDKAICTHVYQLFEVILRKDIGESSFNIYFIFVDVAAIIKHHE
jgi:hypothetical protein